MTDKKSDQGPQSDRKDDAQGEALLNAASTGDLAEAKTLLDNGADPNFQDAGGVTPLHFAAQKGHWDIARLLLEKGASPSITDGHSTPPVVDAARKGHLEIVRLLVECDPMTVNHTNLFFESPLILAAERSDIQMTRYLLEANARTTQSNGLYQTALHIAVKKNCVEIVELLLEYGRKNPPGMHLRMIGIKPAWQIKGRGDGMQGTPLAIAVHDGRAEMVDLLMRTKLFSPESLNARKRLLFHDAVEARDREVVQVFLKYGVKVDVKGLFKRRALHIAAEKGDLAMVELLLEHGASPKAKDHVGGAPETRSTSSEVTMLLRNQTSGKGKGKAPATSSTLPPPPEYSLK